jgi:pilus assembly protein Flp/PilA
MQRAPAAGIGSDRASRPIFRRRITGKAKRSWLMKKPWMKLRSGKKTIRTESGSRLRRDRGATSIEYAILGSLIAAVIVLVVMNLGNQVRLLFESASKGW